MSSTAGKYRYVLLALLVLAVDQFTKWWIEVNLAVHEVRPIVSNLNLTRVTNTGVAFGLLPARGNLWGTLLLTILGLVALGIVIAFFVRARRNEPWLLSGLGLILGGAIGNLVDRVMSGAVTDFVDFFVGSYHWHTFNVADSAITVGIVLMVIDSFSGRASGAAERAEGPVGEPARKPDRVTAKPEVPGFADREARTADNDGT